MVNYGTLISCEELGIHTTGAAAAGDLSHARELKDATRNLKAAMEELKARNQLEWVGRMNNIRNRAEEIIKTELIFV